jgi:hypothetical protein
LRNRTQKVGSFVTFRRIIVGLAVGALALAPSAAIAAKGGHKTTAHAQHKAAGKAKAAERKAAAHARRDAAHARRDARFTATGTLVSVSGDTVTVTVEGGNRKALKGTDAVFTVAEGAHINRDDAPATLADLVAGDHVAVKGARDGETLVATKVNATSPVQTADPIIADPVVTDPTEDPVVTDPTEDPVVTDPTEDPVVTDPTEDPVVTDPTEDPVVDGGDLTDGDPSDTP